MFLHTYLVLVILGHFAHSPVFLLTYWFLVEVVKAGAVKLKEEEEEEVVVMVPEEEGFKECVKEGPAVDREEVGVKGAVEVK